MSARAASLAVLIGAMILGGVGAAECAGAAAPESKAELPLASDVRLGGDDAQTRMVVDLSQKLEIRTFTLANPNRVVIDLP